ncbi:MAG: hypothetical protein ACRCYY_19690 [Trueperaceae bacterium]
MKRQDGIVIIAALMVMISIMGFAIGMIFLSRMNLNIAQNLITKAQAKGSGDGGLDATLVLLNKDYIATGSYPSSASIPTVQVNGATPLSFAQVSFGTSGTSRVLEVKGTSGKAEHVSKVLFTGNTTLGSVVSIPIIARGLVSEGTITVNGGNSSFVSAGIHGNSGFTLSGFNAMDWKTCTTRDSTTGMCTHSQDIPVANIPVSAAAGMTSYTCAPSSNSSLCTGSTPLRLVDKITVTSDYTGKRNATITAMGLPSGGTHSNVFGINCDTVYSSAPSLSNADDVISKGFTAGKVVCVENGNLAFPGDMSLLEGVKIVTKNNVTFAATSTSDSSKGNGKGNGGGNSSNTIVINNSTIVSTGGCVNVTKSEPTFGNNTRIFSECNITLSGTQTEFQGIVTLATKQAIEIDGRSTIASQNGKMGIGLGLLADGNIVVNGRSNWFAVVLTGGTFTKNGTADLIGGVSAKGAITVNGGIDIDSGLDILNPDFLVQSQNQNRQLAEQSRR